MKIALAQINPIIGSLDYNCQKILDAAALAKKKGAQIVVFPELAICGYPPEDLLLLPSFVRAITETLNKIVASTFGITVIVGCVRENPLGKEKKLFNSAAIIRDGELLGFQDKILLPDYDVFSERRYFEPGNNVNIWNLEGKRVAVTICEDIWQHAQAVDYSDYLQDPVEDLKGHSPDFLINLSASPYYIQRLNTRLHVCCTATQTLQCPLFFCNQVGGNDSLIFDGYSLAVAADGSVLNVAKGFEEDLLLVDLEKKYSPISLSREPMEDLLQALVLGVRDYFQKLGWQKCCLGVSGGIDSAVVAVIAQKALGSKNVTAFALPSRYSSEQSFVDAELLTKNLGIRLETLSIEKPFEAFLDILAPHFINRDVDITEENLQARIRGTLLMAFSNKFGYLLLSPANKSELAMGYSTLYGDLCGGLGILSDVTKGQVYALARYINKEKEIIPASILEKAPTAELKFNQKDSDSLPDYWIVDAVLQGYVEEHRSPDAIAEKHQLPLTLVKDLIHKIHLNEYKRKQAPPGLRVTKKSFTMGRRFPIVQHWNCMPNLRVRLKDE